MAMLCKAAITIQRCWSEVLEGDEGVTVALKPDTAMPRRLSPSRACVTAS
jgi:hypothetical protein